MDCGKSFSLIRWAAVTVLLAVMCMLAAPAHADELTSADAAGEVAAVAGDEDAVVRAEEEAKARAEAEEQAKLARKTIADGCST